MSLHSDDSFFAGVAAIKTMVRTEDEFIRRAAALNNSSSAKESFFGGIAALNSSACITFLSMDLGLVVLFWVCTAFRVRISDFVRNYLGSVMLPISISVVFKLFRAILNVAGFSQSGLAAVLRVIDIYFYTVAGYTFVVGTVVFLAMTITVAYKREQIPENVRMRPYLIVLAVSAAVEFVRLVLQSNVVGSSLLGAITVAIFVFSFIGCVGCLSICCVCCCCSQPKYEQDRWDPVVYNARSRMGWVFAFLWCSHISSERSSVEYLYKSISGFWPMKPEEMKEAVDHVVQLKEVMAPLIMLLAVFLLLPTYRTALFCPGNNSGDDSSLPLVQKGQAGLPQPARNQYNPVSQCQA